MAGRDSEWDDIFYTCWLEMLYSAIKGLQFFNKEENMWGQAHIWAAWVIFQCVREDAPGIIKIEFSKTPEGKDWFTMHVDRSKLRSTGF